MRLTLDSQMVDDVVVVRCQGCIVAGAEVAALQTELDKQTAYVKMVVLHLADVDYIDSSGLGALVRALGVLQAAGGSLKLCQASPSVLQVLQVTIAEHTSQPFLGDRSDRSILRAISRGGHRMVLRKKHYLHRHFQRSVGLFESPFDKLGL